MTRIAFWLLISAAAIGATGAVLSFVQSQPGVGLCIALGAAAIEIAVLRMNSGLTFQHRKTRLHKHQRAAAADLANEQNRFGQIGETLAWLPRTE